jgi:hypothetical protein
LISKKRRANGFLNKPPQNKPAATWFNMMLYKHNV